MRRVLAALTLVGLTAFGDTAGHGYFWDDSNLLPHFPIKEAYPYGPAVLVEYLESTGTQYIDLEIPASTTMQPIFIYFEPRANEDVYLIGGGDSASAGFGLRLRGYGNTVISVGFGWTSILTYWNRPWGEPPQLIAINGNFLGFNGYWNNGLSFSATYGQSFYLFARNVGGVASNRCRARIYKAIVGPLYLVPARVGDRGYMLDMMTGRFYGNSGTGEFALGPDITYEEEGEGEME